MIKGFIRLVVAFGMGLALGAPAVAGDDRVHVVLKFLKTDPSQIVAATLDPKSCPVCLEAHDPKFAKNNPKETLIELWVPRGRSLDLGFNITTGVRRVVLETADLTLRRDGMTLTLALPPLFDDAVGAGDMHTLIFEPGLTIRVEHDDLERRDGFYVDRKAFRVERQAADNLTFAQREVIRQLGLDDYVEREGLGKILLMGFDTNYPHGHWDAPPHIHMHMRWPDRAGTQIGHYYLSDKGLLTQNRVGIQMLSDQERVFGPEETFTTTDRLGRGVYSHTITRDGWLKLGRAGEVPCLLSPIKGGFDSGVKIACPGHPQTEVSVATNSARGEITVHTGAITEVFRYDPDTGGLIATPVPRFKDSIERVP